MSQRHNNSNDDDEADAQTFEFDLGSSVSTLDLNEVLQNQNASPNPKSNNQNRQKKNIADLLFSDGSCSPNSATSFSSPRLHRDASNRNKKNNHNDDNNDEADTGNNGFASCFEKIVSRLNVFENTGNNNDNDNEDGIPAPPRRANTILPLVQTKSNQHHHFSLSSTPAATNSVRKHNSRQNSASVESVAFSTTSVDEENNNNNNGKNSSKIAFSPSANRIIRRNQENFFASVLQMQSNDKNDDPQEFSLERSQNAEENSDDDDGEIGQNTNNTEVSPLANLFDDEEIVMDFQKNNNNNNFGAFVLSPDDDETATTSRSENNNNASFTLGGTNTNKLIKREDSMLVQVALRRIATADMKSRLSRMNQSLNDTNNNNDTMMSELINAKHTSSAANLLMTCDSASRFATSNNNQNEQHQNNFETDEFFAKLITTPRTQSDELHQREQLEAISASWFTHGEAENFSRVSINDNNNNSTSLAAEEQLSSSSSSSNLKQNENIKFSFECINISEFNARSMIVAQADAITETLSSIFQDGMKIQQERRRVEGDVVSSSNDQSCQKQLLHSDHRTIKIFDAIEESTRVILLDSQESEFNLIRQLFDCQLAQRLHIGSNTENYSPTRAASVETNNQKSTVLLFGETSSSAFAPSSVTTNNLNKSSCNSRSSSISASVMKSRLGLAKDLSDKLLLLHTRMSHHFDDEESQQQRQQQSSSSSSMSSSTARTSSSRPNSGSRSAARPQGTTITRPSTMQSNNNIHLQHQHTFSSDDAFMFVRKGTGLVDGDDKVYDQSQSCLLSEVIIGEDYFAGGENDNNNNYNNENSVKNSICAKMPHGIPLVKNPRAWRF